MSNDGERIVFDEERAQQYEERFAKLAPLRDAMHLTLRLALDDLDPRGRALCVGAGTGAELVTLAEAFPELRMVAVDPSGPMLAVARRRAAAMGFAARCTFHEGTLDTLPEDGPFDAATTILVSHFFVDPGARRAFFREVAARMKPGARLVSADLAAGATPSQLSTLFDYWSSALRYAGLTEQEVAEYRGNFGSKVAVLSAPQVAALIAEAGFDPPALVFQGVMMHAWCTRRSAA